MRALMLAGSLLALGMTAPALAADAAKPELGSFGFDEAGMDKGVKPGDDFVAYTSGKYLAGLTIPADRSNYGMFTKLRDLSQERTRTIIESVAA
ncbi:MAG: M13 family peptidase, partial [Sphingomonadales bacterium]